MNEPVAEREALWDQFLQRWPLETLRDMTLEQYSQAGTDDYFCRWLEKHTESLGSIWGGSSFKFGVFSRLDKKEKTSPHHEFSDQYAWLKKYGATTEQAFAVVREHIVSVAEAARRGDLESIEQVDLGPVVKWKIAFLYQDRQNPSILCVFAPRDLCAALGRKASHYEKLAPLQRELMTQRQGANLFAFSDQVWERAQGWHRQHGLTEQALDYFIADPERFTAINVTKKMAGFRLSNDRELALLRENGKLSLFVAPGSWQQAIPGLESDTYSPEDTRHSGLPTCAPALAVGNPALSIKLADMAALEAFCLAYEADSMDEVTAAQSVTPASDRQAPPLNQILYGPPGTGKTYATIDAALEILDPSFLAEYCVDRAALKGRFDELCAAGQVRFVTFHQSFSYEDFVEGLRAVTDEDTGQIRYEVMDGVFKSLCEAAAVKVTQQADAPIDLGGRRIWKMSLGNTLGSDSSIYEECIAGGYILLGYGGAIDFSGCRSREDVHQRFVASGHALANPNTDYGLTSVTAFVTRMKAGDLVVVSDGNFKFRAIGEITGDYAYKAHKDFVEDYSQSRPVKWLRTYEPSLPHGELMNNQFSQMTLYELRPGMAVDMAKLALLLNRESAHADSAQRAVSFRAGERFGSGYRVVKASADLLELEKPNGKSLPIGMSLLDTLVDYVRQGLLSLEDIRDKRVFEKVPTTLLEPYLVNGYNNILPPLVERLLSAQAKPEVHSSRVFTNDARVLIIDEINRGNVSRIFGELITLIEPSKREGAEEALSAELPYSKRPFSVPANVYLIGTMNTADRSLAGLDIALRRRFSFKEMPPRPELLDAVLVEGVNIGQLLRVMNQRIEVLLDRDHCLGHAYFMPLVQKPSLARLESIFRNQVLPLLQEYFFEDWQRIQWVLNDHRKASADRFVSQRESDVQVLFGSGVEVSANNLPWSVNEDAFQRVTAYAGIVAVPAKMVARAYALEADEA